MAAGEETQLIVFDVDDTLYLERDYVQSGFRAVDAYVAAELGERGFGDRAWELFIGGVRGNVFDRALADLGIDATRDLVQCLVTVYRTHVPTIALEDDAAATIEQLASTALAIVTDGPIDSQRAKVRALGLARAMREVVFTEELGPGFGKPSPRAFEQLEHSFAVRGPQAVYVADNPAKDFVAPRALGWATVRVRRAGSLHEGVESGPDVDREVTDLGDLAGWIGGR
jgi:putative hydrolase of the HAD superfamily